MSSSHISKRRRELRRFRRYAGLTQADIGGMAGITGAMVAAFENGTSDFSAETRKRIESSMEDVHQALAPIRLCTSQARVTNSGS